jgi:hypothetical protein
MYGKSGANREVAQEQFQKITLDMDKIKRKYSDTDFIFLGDINAHMGVPT